MQFLNFTIIKLSIFLILGIITGFSIDLPAIPLFIFLGALFLIFCISFFRARKKLFDDTFFGICTWSLIFSLGMATAYLHQPKNQPQHYINLPTAEADVIQIRVIETLKPNLYNQPYIAEAERIFSDKNSTPVTGKILLNISKDSISSNIKPGMKLLVPGKLTNIAEPLNPYRFNYRKFMQKQKVEKQLQLRKAEIQILPHSEKRLLTHISNFRERLIQNLSEAKFNKDELAIMQALLLGQRQDISKEIYDEYAAAGAIHILAVSGLHVGIILLILNWLFAPLNYLKNGLVLKTFILISINVELCYVSRTFAIGSSGGNDVFFYRYWDANAAKNQCFEQFVYFPVYFTPGKSLFHISGGFSTELSCGFCDCHHSA